MENNKEVKLLRLQRTEGKLLTESQYNIVIGLTLLWGILINVGMAVFLTPYIIINGEQHLTLDISIE